ncbi:MAG: xanthine dehydrogenase family protein molybdopterin-binding subunit [Candidatus Rokubacteria bacterium]|nr:xanthine dehydrogenase family protein molybdopterin-binding subunit [Candidatus Rokubacteria bacterium]
MTPTTAVTTPSKLMGAEVKRKEDPRMITGRSTYVTDIVLPGMLWVAFVRSPHAHARIRKIDASVALKVPGVRQVVTGDDIRTLAKAVPPASASAEGGASAGAPGRQHWALSTEVVRHAGEAVAAVIADSDYAAHDGVEAVQVDWEPLPAVTDVWKALEKGAPQLHTDAPGNIEHENQITGGDVDAVFKSAKKVIKQRIVSQRLAGISMEPRACVAAPEGISGGIVVYATHQAPHNLRADLANVLGMDANLIRVVNPDMGGGFGVKFGCYPEDVVLAALARKLKTPLKWVETRVEHMLATTHGRDQAADIEVAVQPDGTVDGLRMKVTANIGAYPVFTFIPDLTLFMGVGVYKFTNVDVSSRCVFTNTTSVAAYRGAGRPEAAYYLERTMDIIAAELKLEPEAVRRKNFIPPSAFPYMTPTGQFYDTGEYDKALTRALELANVEKLRREQADRLKGGDAKLLGIGIACYVEMCGFGPYESAVVRVDSSGTVTVLTGTSAHGQGHETTFAQIVADHLGVDFDKIVVKHGDTMAIPMGNGTGGSRSVAVGGSSVYNATLKVQAKARTIAASMLEASADDVVLQDGRYMVKGTPSKALGLAEIAAVAYGEALKPEIEHGLEASEFWRPPGGALVYPFGAHIAVVEVDKDTGHVRVLDYVSVDDCGVRISPNLVSGQVHGGLAQGIAQALWEDVRYGEDGQLLTGSLMDYAIPRAEDLPMFRDAATVTPTPRNPLGAKGIGEAATIGSTPAVVNAVVDALRSGGVTHLDMPLRGVALQKR